MTRRIETVGIAMLMLVALRAPASATVDLNGQFVGAAGAVLGFGPFPCTSVAVTQTGTALSLSATCDVLGSPATFTGSGTIDTGTGAFSVTGQSTFGLCNTPGSFHLTGTGSADSYSISGTVTCSLSLGFFASRCGNGILDAGEAQSCDDAAASGVPTLSFPACCTDQCALQPNGTQCSFSVNGFCDALDFCDGASPTCPNLTKPNGTPCDGGPCTENNTCNGGLCTGGTPAPAGTDCSEGSTDPCFDALCDSAGGCIISPTNNPCDDGDACTTNDHCQDFSCVSGGPPPCNPCETCDSVDGCVAEIQSGCDHPLSTKSSVGIKDTTPDTKDRVAWTFIDGPGSATGAFGDPTSDTDYALCVYDDSGVSPIIVASGTAPAGTSWSANSKGFKYKSASSSLTKAQLKVAGGKTKLMVKGVGAGLGLPPSLNSLALPVVVQLKASNGQCWQTTFPTSKVSNPITFKAKGGQ